MDRRFARNYAGELSDGQRPDWKKIDARLAEAAARAEPLAPEEHQYVIALYDGGVRAADQLVEALLTKLDDQGLAQDTLVMVTSDHGEELGDHGAYYYHGNSVYDGTLRVPWIVRWPGVLEPGTTFEPLVQNVDVLPTLLAWLGADVPQDVEGVSLAPWLGPQSRAGRDDAPRAHVFSEWQDLIWTARDTEHKLVLNPRGAHPRKPPFDRFERGFRIGCRELYGIVDDPGERSPLPFEGSAAGEVLRGEVERFRGRPGVLSGWNVVRDAAVEENLASLGYVGTDEERSDVILDAEDCDG